MGCQFGRTNCHNVGSLNAYFSATCRFRDVKKARNESEPKVSPQLSIYVCEVDFPNISCSQQVWQDFPKF